MKKQMRNKGITLLVLAITIVVLLILTGVTVSTIGNNQIFSKANISKNQTEISEEKNILKASVLYAQNIDNVGELSLENLRQGLDRNIDEKYQNLEEIDNAEYGKIYQLKFKKTGNSYIILGDGTIYSESEFYNNNNDSLNILPSSIANFIVGDQQEIQILGGILTNSNIQITWKSTNEESVKIQENMSDKTKIIATANSSGNSKIEAKVEVMDSTGKVVKTKTAICSILVRDRNIMIGSINLESEDLTIDLSSDNIKRQIIAKTDEDKVIDNIDIKWKSLQPEVASVDENGIVTGISNGTAIISATIDNGKYATIPVIVRTTPIEVKFDESNLIIDLSEKKTSKLETIIVPSTANYQTGLTWTSSNTSVATVDEKGNITGVSNGTTIIRVETENGKAAETELTVQTSPTEIVLDKAQVILDMSGNKTTKLTATIKPSTANVKNKVMWTIDNPVVAKVENGTVTGLSNGSTKLTVRTENGLETTCVIVVETSITSIEIIPKTATINMSEKSKLQFDKKIMPESATELVTWTSSNTSVATVDKNGLVTGLKSGVVTITVKNPSGEKFDTATVTVIQKPTESTPVENVKFSTEYGRIDVIWLDNNNNVISTPNAPILTSNGESLTPIKWNGSSEQTTSSEDSSWYDYNSNVWANAKTKNGSYFVWIPRFAYRIKYYSDSNCTNLTGYFDGLGQWSKDGKLRRKLDSGIKKLDYNGESYIVHPAFETDLENGGWSNELSGFWVAKFQASPTSYREVKFVPGENSSNINRSIGQQYYYARTAKYGYTGTTDTDGYTSFMYSHMMKNSEWGAVAYLTHSKYGKNGNEITQNTSYYTGGGYNERYTSNTSQSSTGNIYGIYDLSGCSYEYVAAFISKDSYGKFSTYDWTRYTGLKPTSASTKYATRYDNTYSSYYTGNFIVYNCGKIGDASKEVNTGGHDTTDSRRVYKNWLKDDSNFPFSEYPFFVRGGYRGDSTYSGLAGVFFTGYADGHNSDDNSFRAVLCP